MSVVDDILNTAKSVADITAKKAGETVELSKLKMESIKINAQIDKKYNEIGNLVYDASKSGVSHEETIQECISEIDALVAKIGKINAQINEVKRTVTCPNCLYTNPDDAVYCAKCGVKLDVGPKEFYEEAERKEAAEAVDEAVEVSDPDTPESKEAQGTDEE